MGSLSLILLKIDLRKFIESTLTKGCSWDSLGLLCSKQFIISGLIHLQWSCITLFLDFQTSKKHIDGACKRENIRVDKKELGSSMRIHPLNRGAA